MKTVFLREGELKYSNTVLKLIEEGKINAENFSLLGLYKSMGEPDLGQMKRDELKMSLMEADLRESMDSSAFPKITGALIVKMVQDSYQLAPSVGDQLVTVVPASQKDDTIVGFGASDNLEEVFEGAAYQEGAFTEKYHKIRNRKFGRLLSLTAEMIRFDQTREMVQRAQAIGEMARSKKEEIIMKGICEYASTGAYASWRPAGTSTTLYSDTSTDPYSPATFDNVITSNLADESDLDDAMANLAAATDENGNPITVTPTHLLCSPARLGRARKIAYSTQFTVANTPAGVSKPADYNFIPLGSPWVTSLLSSVYWLYGEFKKQFVYTEVFPLETFQERSPSNAEFERDILYRYKARFMGGCGAVSNKFVIRSTGAV